MKLESSKKIITLSFYIPDTGFVKEDQVKTTTTGARLPNNISINQLPGYTFYIIIAPVSWILVYRDHLFFTRIER
jgi:hypothetical protein